VMLKISIMISEMHMYACAMRSIRNWFAYSQNMNFTYLPHQSEMMEN